MNYKPPKGYKVECRCSSKENGDIDYVICSRFWNNEKQFILIDITNDEEKQIAQAKTPKTLYNKVWPQ